MSELFAGVDLGGTRVKAAVAAERGEILAHGATPTAGERGPEAVIDAMTRLTEGLARQVGGELRAVGVGCPGLVDRERGITRFLPNLPGQWRDVPLGDRLAERLGARVHLLNDARMATLGELRFGWGLGRERPTLLLLTLGTGIGGGVVVDGRLRLGPLGAAGELGHVPVDPEGEPCACGSRGCVETVASGPALVRAAARRLGAGETGALAAAGDPSRLTPEAIGAAARAGDPVASAVVAAAGRALGLALSGLVLALHPEAIVLAGGVAAIGEPLRRAIRAELEARVTMLPVASVALVESPLGGRAGALGGVALARAGGVV
ncbi:MAG TPA: ROK family protein [Thermoanaerobaculia bacterium]|nr:ROK family protein [Thermoanaerobaculia bacterium]